MNLKEIEQRFLEDATLTAGRIISRIDNLMVYDYNSIKKHKKIIIPEAQVNQEDKFPDYKKDTIVKMLRDHYKKDWDIEWDQKKHNLTFTLKESVQEKIEVVIKKEPEPIKSRSEILDI